MNKLYLITGPAGVGKSTVSKIIANKLEKSILIEGDYIYHIVEAGYVSAWKENNHLTFFWKNIKDLIKNGLEEGYDVVFNYIITKKDYEFLMENFKEYDVIFKVLITSEEELLRRDSLREIDVRMNERCIVLLNSFKKQNFSNEHIIDTTNLNIDETVNKIMKG